MKYLVVVVSSTDFLFDNGDSWKLLYSLIWASWIWIRIHNCSAELPDFCIRVFCFTYTKITFSDLLASQTQTPNLFGAKKIIVVLENSKESNGTNQKSIARSVLKSWIHKLEKFFLRFGKKRDFGWNQNNIQQLMWKLILQCKISLETQFQANPKFFIFSWNLPRLW